MGLDTEIPEAMCSSGSIVIDDLKDYQCEKDNNNLYDIKYEEGGFCYSFPLRKDGVEKKECLRLWWKDWDREKRQEYVKDVSKYFSSHVIKYVKQYRYEDNALRLEDGTIIPGVVMEWVEGQTLIEYVKANCYNKSAMLKIAHSFLEMVQYFNKHNMAHGDLSGVNIIVEPSGNLCLIDYDSFYISGYTENVIQMTKGAPGYQHPGRENTKFLSKTMDYFSQLIIYLSLLAISEKPDLFNKNLADKSLLFKKDDIYKIAHKEEPEIYKDLLKIDNLEIQKLLKQLKISLESPIEPLYPLVVLNNLFYSFCGRCGHHFLNQTDIFCPDCGKKRETL